MQHLPYTSAPLLYLPGWNLEVGLLVEPVGHLEGGGALHLPDTFQGDHVQLKLGDQVKPWRGAERFPVGLMWVRMWMI